MAGRKATGRRRIVRIFLTICLGAAPVVTPSAGANTVTLSDPTDQSDDNNDIAQVRHRHHPADTRVLRHIVWFDGQQAEPTEVKLHLRHRKGDSVRRLHVVIRREQGGLAAEIRDERERRVSGARAWTNDDVSRLVIQFRRRVFGQVPRYRWSAESLLGIGEFQEPCDGEDTGPPVCLDRAPATGWIEHRIR